MKKQKANFWQTMLLFGVLLLFSPQMYAQIKGKVTDTNGSPIPGTTVREKGSKSGTISDSNGNFQIKIEKTKGAVLLFSFVGMEAQEVSVDGRTTINVVLSENSEKLDEVVVVAYGTQKKVSLTGAVNSISNKDLMESPSPNLVGSLAGRLAGLTTIQTSGQPGSEDFSMYIRGASTTNGQDPLILVDGVPRDNISSMDANEIASLSILKDASATAVFGVRGANGVILITTKRGENEKPQLSVTAEYSMQNYPRQPETINSWEWAGQRNQALTNDGLIPFYSADQIAKYKNGVNLYLYPNNNWNKIILKPYAPMSKYNVNATGGNDRVKYFLNASYTNQGGQFNTESKDVLGYDPQFKLNRFNFRTNLDVKLNDWIKSSLNLSGYIDNVNAPGSHPTQRGNPLYVVLGLPASTPVEVGPTIQPGYSGGPVGSIISMGQSGGSSYGYLNRSGYVNTDRVNLFSSLSFDFNLSKITKGLTSRVLASFDSRSSTITDANKQFNSYKYTITQATDPVTGVISDNILFYSPTTPQFYPLILTKSTTFYYKVNLQWHINYARSFGKHQVSGLLLAQRDNSESIAAGGDQLIPFNVIGVSSRFTYNYDNRYLAEVNMGYNGSEQFAKENRFGFFPAGSVGWMVSNEKFMKTQKVITNLKLRASYGKVGNDKLGSSRFLYLDNINVAGGGYSSSLGLGNYVNETLIGNPLITWETSYKQNYGIDLAIFRDLTFTGDYFIENRNNILLTPGSIPALQGIPLATLPKLNVGVVNNQGFELQLSYKKKINNDLFFSISGNYNYCKNSVIDIDEAPNDPTYPYKWYKTGYSLKQNWGMIIDWNSSGHGFWTSQDEITNSGLKFDGIQPKPGDFVYKDVNGDGIINNKDYAPIKYGALPRITYGLNLSVSYKGFDLSALLQGVAQVSEYYSGWGVMEYDGNGNYYKYMQNAWTPELYNAGATISYPRLTTIAGGSSSEQPNSYFCFDKSYTRLKNAEIGYSIPTKLLKKIGLQKVRIYANGQNLLLWDNLPTKNFDPEQSNALSVPIPRVINFGANIVF